MTRITHSLLSIRSKMLFFFTLAFAGILLTSEFIIVQRTTKMANDQAKAAILEATKQAAHEMEIALNGVDDALAAIAVAFNNFERIPVDQRRDFFDHIMEDYIEEDDLDVVSVWACFEPNTLDGKDEEYINTEYSDATGRYLSFFSLDGKEAVGTALTDYDVPGDGDYYLVAFNSGKPNVTESIYICNG